MGINVDATFLGLAANFLHCSISYFPFKYLGFPIGANSKRLSTWQPLLDTLVSHQSKWRRVILLDSALNYIPIFFLSFLKMSNGF